MIKFLLKFTWKILLVALSLVGLILIVSNLPVKSKNEQMSFHLSFSQLYASALGLDWKEVYQEMLTDLKPKKLRIASYWTEIEKQKGVYDWEALDWMIEEAEKNDTGIILAFGIKAPRWPECFIPDFYLDDKEARESALLSYEKVLLERYKDNATIVMWQVENEPFLPFGHCIKGAVDANLVDQEIAQVKSIDSRRPIMVTDSGELSIWIQAAKRADIFGTTLYRIIHKEPFGYIRYPLGPSFFRAKAMLIKIFANQERIIISELQAEPWAKGWVLNNSVEEQYKSMSPEKFAEIIDYAQKTNFEEAYLWGVEWWYWLRENQMRPEMWEEAKKIIRAGN